MHTPRSIIDICSESPTTREVSTSLLPSPTDIIRIEACCDNTAIYQLLPNILPCLERFARRLTGHFHDAEDLVQRTCVRALECGYQLRPGSSVRGWLNTIMYSLWMNELRARRLRSNSHAQWCDNCSETIGYGPDIYLQYQQVLAILDRLPEAQRMVLRLIVVEGCSYKEAASHLDLPIGTITSRLTRARNAVDRMMSAGGRMRH